MKKILIALMLVAAMLVVTACGASKSDSAEPAVSSTDISSTDASNSDITPTDVIPAPEGFTGCIIGDIYFCYPEAYTKTVASDTDAVSVSADGDTGANFSVTKSAAVDMDVALLSRTDLDAIGEKGAKSLASVLGEGVTAEYAYVDSGSVLDGSGIYFDFDITANYEALNFSQTFSYHQVYVGKGSDLYIFTFATNKALGDSNASEYFADVIGSIKFSAE